MRIAFFSPLPPEPTGIGDYSYELLEELRELVDVTAVVRDDRRDAAQAPVGVEVVGASSVDSATFDANVYQMGNNPKYHRFVCHRAFEEPGLLVMHDPSLADYLAELCGGAESSIFRDEVTYDCPDIGPDDDLPLVDVGDGTKNLDRLRVLLARRIVGANVRTLVNSEAMAIEMRRRYPGSDIHAIQLPARVVQSASRQLDRDADAAVRFGVFGGINYYKRIRPTVDAFIKLHERYPEATMVVAGRADDRLLAAEIRRIAARPDLGGALVVKTELTLDQLEQEMATCDVAISLRWPTAGEMSATLMRSFGAGCPAVVSDVLQFRELDERYCWRVPVSPPEAEADALLRIMETAAADPTRCRRLGQAARQFVETEANYRAVAQRYVEHLEDCIPRLPAARRAHRPRMLDSTTPRGVNVMTLDNTGEAGEYARRLSDALLGSGVDVVEIEVRTDLLPDPDTKEWDFDPEPRSPSPGNAKVVSALAKQRAERLAEEVPDNGPLHFGPHDIDVLVVGERDAERLGYVSRRGRSRGHHVVPVVAPSWVPLPLEYAPVVRNALEVWTPGQEPARSIRDGSVYPVRALPPLVSGDVVSSLPGTSEICTFAVCLDVRDSFARQNPWASIEAFRLAFTAEDRNAVARLVVGVLHLDPRTEGGRRLEAELGRGVGDLVRLDNLKDLRAQVASADVFVSLHRSEGFGTHVLDAMTIGRPVIATAFLGIGEYLTPGNGCPVGYSVRDADIGEYYLDTTIPARARRGEVWADADISQAAEWMRTLAANRSLRLALGDRAAQTAREIKATDAGLADWVAELTLRRQMLLSRAREAARDDRRRFDSLVAQFAGAGAGAPRVQTID